MSSPSRSDTVTTPPRDSGYGSGSTHSSPSQHAPAPHSPTSRLAALSISVPTLSTFFKPQDLFDLTPPQNTLLISLPLSYRPTVQTLSAELAQAVENATEPRTVRIKSYSPVTGELVLGMPSKLHEGVSSYLVHLIKEGLSGPERSALIEMGQTTHHRITVPLAIESREPDRCFIPENLDGTFAGGDKRATFSLETAYFESRKHVVNKVNAYLSPSFDARPRIIMIADADYARIHPLHIHYILYTLPIFAPLFPPLPANTTVPDAYPLILANGGVLVQHTMWSPSSPASPISLPKHLLFEQSDWEVPGAAVVRPHKVSREVLVTLSTANFDWLGTRVVQFVGV